MKAWRAGGREVEVDFEDARVVGGVESVRVRELDTDRNGRAMKV